MLNKVPEQTYIGGKIGNAQYKEFADLSGIKLIRTSIFDTILVKQDNSIYVSGRNAYSLLGLGHANPLSRFEKVNLPSDIKSIKDVRIGNECAFILTDDGDVYWSGRNANWRAGLIDNTISTTTFIKHTGIDNVKSMHVYSDCAFYVSNNGEVFVTGNVNSAIMAGNGYVQGFTKIEGFNNVKKVSGTSSNMCCLLNNGEVWVKGDNFYGTLGLGFDKGTTSDYKVTTPVKVTAYTSLIRDVEITGSNAMWAIDVDGNLLNHGYSQTGSLGMGDASGAVNTPRLTNLKNVKSVPYSYNYGHYVLLDNGDVYYCGGFYTQSMLSKSVRYKSSALYVNYFTKVEELKNIKQLATGNGMVYLCLNDSGELIVNGGPNVALQGSAPYDYNNLGNGRANEYSMNTKLNFTNIKDMSFNEIGNMLILNENGELNSAILDAKDQLIMGDVTTFILKANGDLYGAGLNTHAQLGRPISINHYPYFIKLPISNVKKVVPCTTNTFVLKNDGTVWAVGSNTYGQLSAGGSASQIPSTQTFIQCKYRSSDPIQDWPMTHAVDIWAAKTGESLFVLTPTQLLSAGKSAGIGRAAQVGTTSATYYGALVQVTTASVYGVKKIVAVDGDSAILLRGDGRILTTGTSASKGLGEENASTRTYFSALSSGTIPSDVIIKDITAMGGNGYVAYTENYQRMYSWGLNADKVLGGSGTSISTAQYLSGTLYDNVRLYKWEAYGFGEKHTVCKLDKVKDNENKPIYGEGSGNLYCLGSNVGTTTTKQWVQIMEDGSDIKNIYCGNSCTIYEKYDGTLLVQGGTYYIGYGSDSVNSNTSSLKEYVSLNNHKELTDKNYSIRKDNKVYIMDPDGRYSRVFDAYAPVLQFDMGKTHAIGINGSVGMNTYGNVHTIYWDPEYNYGQHGQLEGNASPYVTHSIGMNGAKLVACGDYSSYIYMENGDFYSFGRNNDGQLGLGGTENESRPTLVPNVGNVKKMVAEGSNCFVLTTDNILKGVGGNLRGQLGQNNNNSYNRFVEVANGVEDFWFNKGTLIYMKDGYLWACGDNTANKLGYSESISNINVPVQIMYVGSVKTIAIGDCNVGIVMNSNSTPVITYVEKSIPNFKIALYDEDLVECKIYLNNNLLRTINQDLTNQVHTITIPEASVNQGPNVIEVRVRDSAGNTAADTVPFSKNNLAITTGTSILYKNKKYVVQSVSDSGENKVLQLDRLIESAVNAGDDVRILNDDITVGMIVDASGNEVEMQLESMVKTNRNTVRANYKLTTDCRIVAPIIHLNSVAGSTKISRITLNASYKED